MLVDLGLPDTASPTATVEKLKAIAQEISTIVLSGNKDAKLALGAIKCGIVDYLVSC